MSEEQDERPVSYHAREAVTQWGRAIRLGAVAMSPVGRGGGKLAKAAKSALPNPSTGVAKEKLGSEPPDGGGVVDAGLSKLGAGGKAAVALRKGVRAARKLKPNPDLGAVTDKFAPGDGVLGKLTPDGGVLDKLTPDGGMLGALRSGAANGDHANDFDDGPIPIQESIDVAVPINVAYDLCTRFEEYPGFISHIERAEREAGDEVSFATRMRGSTRRLEVEIYDQIENERIDWRSTGGTRHSGVITFHELAPRLTHIELSVDHEPQGLVQRISRSAHFTERAVRAEMRRFKAFAELGEDEGGDPPPLAEQEAEAAAEAEAEEERAEQAADEASLQPDDDEEDVADGEELDDEDPEAFEEDDFEDADDAEDEDDDEAEDERDDDDADFEVVEGELSEPSEEDGEFDPEEIEQAAR